jgi:hypothetical protein
LDSKKSHTFRSSSQWFLLLQCVLKAMLICTIRQLHLRRSPQTLLECYCSEEERMRVGDRDCINTLHLVLHPWRPVAPWA